MFVGRLTSSQLKAEPACAMMPQDDAGSDRAFLPACRLCKWSGVAAMMAYKHKGALGLGSNIYLQGQ